MLWQQKFHKDSYNNSKKAIPHFKLKNPPSLLIRSNLRGVLVSELILYNEQIIYVAYWNNLNFALDN